MHIVTVWSGGKYSFDYVTSLKNQVRKHTGQELITVGVDVPLRTHWAGWCSKIELFAPWQTFRPCLYLDLDTFVLKPLPKFDTPNQLHLIRDFNMTERGNSGVMLIPKDTAAIWEGGYDGRQPDGNYLNSFDHVYINDRFPRLITSYKKNKCYEHKPQSPIMCFHGKPKPHDAKGWAQEYWLNHLDDAP